MVNKSGIRAEMVLGYRGRKDISEGKDPLNIYT